MPMETYDISILTDRRYLEPRSRDSYVQNLLEEDRLVREALEKRGLRVQRINWDHPEMDWRLSRYVLFRSTWDYFDRFPEFEPWLDRVKELTGMINPYDIIRWNLDKHYLAELAAEGVNIPPTQIIESGESATLSTLVAESRWKEVILKPVVSGAARHTYRFLPGEAAKLEDIYRRLIEKEALMIQEFQEQVPRKGEVALMLFGGKFSHAILKKAKAGDFRVQDDFGGTVHPYQANSREIEFAERVLALCHPRPLYARVDMIWDNQDQLALSELELIEPELWFRFRPQAASLLADCIVESCFKES